MFEKATKLKFRYKVGNGFINTEDLWDLKLEDLDKLAKSLNKELKESEEESFIKTKTLANKKIEDHFEIVKHVITVKLAEKQAKVEAIEKQQRKAFLKELIDKKEIEEVSNKTLEDLKKEYEELS